MNRTYGSLKLLNGKWFIAECEPHVSIKLKAIFRQIKATTTTPYEFPDTPETAIDLDWFLQRYPLEMSPEATDRLAGQKQTHLQKQGELERLFSPDYQAPLFAMKKGALRPFQSQGVDLYLKNQMLLCGDQVGMGKTFIALGSFADPRTLPCAVVVQAHLPKQWKDRIEEYTNLKVHVIKKRTPYQLPPADIYIFKYSNIGYWIDTFAMKIFKSVVYDEVQELRHTDSDKYRGARVLSKSADFVLGLTATPIYNYGVEIYNILHAMREDCLGGKDAFLREWAGGGENRIQDPKALGTYLRENYLFLRRTREEVGQQMPPVNKIIETVDYDEKAISDIEALARTLAIRTTSGAFIERGQAARELDLLVRQATGVSKARSVAAYVRMLLECGESVLLAGWHRDVYEIWLKKLAEFKPAMYTGTESPAQKEKTKQAFISGDSKLMIISLRSGVGLDGLQTAGSIVVFGELDWSPAVQEQLIGRLDREGQAKQVTAIYLVSDSGSDPPMIELLGLKASQSQGIIDPLMPLQMTHTDQSRIQLLAKQYLEKKGTSCINPLEKTTTLEPEVDLLPVEISSPVSSTNSCEITSLLEK